MGKFKLKMPNKEHITSAVLSMIILLALAGICLFIK